MNTDELRRIKPILEAFSGAEDKPSLPPLRLTDELLAIHLLSSTYTSEEPHTYVLTKDKFGGLYDGPSWVPNNLYHARMYSGNSPLVKECAGKLIDHDDAEGLWAAIANKYERPDNIALKLPDVCAKAIMDWRSIPRETPAQHKAKREDMARKARQLATELERFYVARDPDEHELTGIVDWTQLMDDDELEGLDVEVRRVGATITNRARNYAGLRSLEWEDYNSIGDESRALGYRDNDIHTPARRDAHAIYNLMLMDHYAPFDYPNGGIPTLPDMMRRIANKFDADGDDPPLTRPNAANTERNRFAHVIIRYFLTGYQTVIPNEASPNIVARIVSVFFSQGITDNEVSQMIPKVRTAYQVPALHGPNSESFHQD